MHGKTLKFCLSPYGNKQEGIFIRKRNNFVRKRKFKRISDRKLSLRDLAVLDFLWTWKVATTPMLGEVAYKGKSSWWVYKALRQLQKERFIQRLPRGKNIEQELWALTPIMAALAGNLDRLNHWHYFYHFPVMMVSSFSPLGKKTMKATLNYRLAKLLGLKSQTSTKRKVLI